MIKVIFMVYIFSISSLFSFLFVVFISAEDHTKRVARFFIQPQHTLSVLQCSKNIYTVLTSS